MPQISFHGTSSATPHNDTQVISDVREGTKVLAVAIRHKVPIRYGCASCRCGTCAVKVLHGKLSAMEDDERKLLQKVRVLQGDQIRLSCRAKITTTDCAVDLAFQKTYNPATPFDESTIAYPSSPQTSSKTPSSA